MYTENMADLGTLASIREILRPQYSEMFHGTGMEPQKERENEPLGVTYKDVIRLRMTLVSCLGMARLGYCALFTE
jgi:hypothetical protein